MRLDHGIQGKEMALQQGWENQTMRIKYFVRNLSSGGANKISLNLLSSFSSLRFDCFKFSWPCISQTFAQTHVIRTKADSTTNSQRAPIIFRSLSWGKRSPRLNVRFFAFFISGYRCPELAYTFRIQYVLSQHLRWDYVCENLWVFFNGRSLVWTSILGQLFALAPTCVRSCTSTFFFV